MLFGAAATMPGAATEVQSEDGEDFDLWYVGVMLMVLSTFFGALGNIFIKQSFNVTERADADSSLTPAARRHARLVSWAFWLLGAPVFTIVLGSMINVAAFAFAAQSLLSPFAATTIVWNTVRPRPRRESAVYVPRTHRTRTANAPRTHRAGARAVLPAREPDAARPGGHSCGRLRLRLRGPQRAAQRHHVQSRRAARPLRGAHPAMMLDHVLPYVDTAATDS